jgi:ParB-like chromosome segregation protein Spo0J
MFLLMPTDELQALGTDIREHGMIERITLYEGKILDGRNRYRAAKVIGYKLTSDNFRTLPSDKDPTAFVIGANIHRRHLTTEQKRNLLAELIKADPTKSNRQIADQAKVSHVTVGGVRSELETTGQIDQLPATTGKDGKARKRKGAKGRAGKGGAKSEQEKITYQKVINSKTALNAYSLLEQHLLDALEDINEKSSFAHADEYARRTIEKLEEKLDELQPAEEEVAEAA